MDDKPGLFAELKRRNMLRAAILYVGAAWALAQGISQLTPTIGLPDLAARWFLIAATCGFPAWVAFAWFHEVTPPGLRRESGVAPGESTTRATARKLDLAIIGVLAVAVVLLASGYFIRRNAPGAAAAAFDPPVDTLVVLPFKNLNDDPGQRYFSDGITEELTGALGRNGALRVIAWGTASRFRDSAIGPARIGRQLNIANLLHGSIERDGDRVRIVAELVDTRTGLQRWSQHYDEGFADIFKVQDEVSEAIAAALKVKLAPAAALSHGTTNPRAHELVLKGRALLNKFDRASLAAAQGEFEQAVALDPDYADAHALLADALLAMSERADAPLDPVLPRVRAEADKALELDPRDAGVWVTLGVADAGSNPPNAALARSEFRQALALDPSNAAAHNNYANLLPLKPALAEVRQATLLAPTDEAAWNNLIVDAQDLADWTQEVHAAETLLRLDPAIVDSAFSLAYAWLRLGRQDRALAAFDLAKASTPLDREQVDAGRLTYRAVAEPALRPRALAALRQLERFRSNQSVVGNLLVLYLTLDQTAPALQLLQGSCPGDPIGCSDLGVNPAYQALHGNAAFDALAKKYTTATVQ